MSSEIEISREESERVMGTRFNFPDAISKTNTDRDDQRMPSGKDRKEDTWKESELKKVLKPDDKKRSKDEQGKRSSKERSSQRSDAEKREQKETEDDRKRRRHDDVANGETDHRRRDRERDREKDWERERRKRDDERDKERPRERDRDHDREKRREKEGRERNKDSERSKDRERRKDRDYDDKERDRDRRARDPEKAKDGSGHERRERHSEREKSKERDGNRERRKEKSSGERDRERRKEKEQEKKGEADGHERRKDRDTSRERRKDREREGKVRDTSPDRRREKERVSGKDRDTSRDRRKDREREDRDRGKERTKDHDKDRERRKDRDREKDRERRKERERDRPDKGDKVPDKDERRKSERHAKDSERKSKAERYEERDKEERIKRREKELMDSLKQEEEESRKERLKFRSDTIEEADTVDEDVEQKRKASSPKASVVAADEVHDEENNGFDYEDDEFEDYDEDFEDDEEDDGETSVDLQDHSGMQELLQAINAENQDARASSSEGKEEKKGHKESQKEAKVRPSTSSHGRINFVAAKQKQITDQVASRTRRRGQELMHLIDLDVAAFDIFDLPPLNEYELYIKNFGRSDTKQAYVQCNEDNLEKEVQTEEVEMRTKWTQNPASDAAGFGDDEDDLQEDLFSLTEKANIDSLRLSRFLQRAAQTCLILLEENVSEQTSTQFKERKDMTCSDGFMQLSTKHLYLEGRPVTCVHISPVQTHFLLIAYGAVTEKGKATSKINISVQEKGLVCFWNTNEPSEPQRILICESTPRCCCLSPSKATLAFAGLDDGTLVAWDLREPSSMHFASRISVGDSDVFLRSPTFSTAGVLKKDESHLSPVVSLLPLVMPGDRVMLQEISATSSARASGGSNMMSDDMLGLSFQLASLEENAVIYLWVVVELERANSAGSESDLGLSPGGKIKLIRSSSITLHSPFRGLQNEMTFQALILRFLPHDPNHVYIGTDGGYILHCERHGGRAPPKAHRPDTENIVRISALDLSPWQLPCLLAGSESGSLWLFNIKNELPLANWPASTGSNGILSVQWSRSRPSVFYVLDFNSNLYVWDLLKSDEGPVAVEKFKHGRVTCFELSSDYSASGIGVPGRNPELVLVFESGVVEIHKISSLFSSAAGDELDRFTSYLDSVL